MTEKEKKYISTKEILGISKGLVMYERKVSTAVAICQNSGLPPYAEKIYSYYTNVKEYLGDKAGEVILPAVIVECNPKIFKRVEEKKEG